MQAQLLEVRPRLVPATARVWSPQGGATYLLAQGRAWVGRMDCRVSSATSTHTGRHEVFARDEELSEGQERGPRPRDSRQDAYVHGSNGSRWQFLAVDDIPKRARRRSGIRRKMADDTEMKIEPQAEAEAPAAEPAATEQAAAAAPEAEPAKEEPAKEEPAAESAAAEGVDNAGEGEEEDAGEGEGEEAEGDAEGGEEGAEEGGATPAGESKKRKAEGPIQLGYKTFQDLKSCQEYFKTMLNNMPLDTDVNEYEYRVLLDLIQQGHPNAAKKIGGGLRAFQVRRFNDDPVCRAFYALRKDGSLEDFSYLKCTYALWGEEPTGGLKRHHGGRGGGGGGGGGGFRGGRGGRGFGGRGGRDGGGRGRGGGRGGRFSRGRGRGRF